LCLSYEGPYLRYESQCLMVYHETLTFVPQIWTFVTQTQTLVTPSRTSVKRLPGGDPKMRHGLTQTRTLGNSLVVCHHSLVASPLPFAKASPRGGLLSKVATIIFIWVWESCRASFGFGPCGLGGLVELPLGLGPVGLGFDFGTGCYLLSWHRCRLWAALRRHC
jgi:hypothetical protein